MITVKSEKEIELMRKAGQLSFGALMAAGREVRPGVSTKYLDDIVRQYIESRGGTPNCLGYGGFPGSACISVNEEIIHGIPSENRILKEGDIVTIDTGATLDGFNGDNAETFAVGEVSKNARDLMKVTKAALFEAMEFAVAGNRVGDIGACVQRYCELRGYGVIREYCGHGIGKELHEEPSVPNYGREGHGVRLVPGMTICIEPMINEGTRHIKQLSDGWTVVTADGKLAAHFERTVLITGGKCEILTRDAVTGSAE